MKDLQQILLDFYNNTPSFSDNTILLKNIVAQLNKNSIIILTWMEWTQKLWAVKHIIEKTKMENSFSYFNGNMNIKNTISTYSDLNTLSENKKIIILENITWIENIDIFIQEQFKKCKKVIIIGNGFSLKWVPEIEMLPTFNNNLKIDKELLLLKAHKILSQDIYIRHKLKNFPLLQNIIEELALWNGLTSVRSLHMQLTENNSKISQITLLEYIEYILESKLAKKAYRYDFKAQTSSKGKAKYFFADTNIRNALSYFSLPKETYNENLVFQKLSEIWWDIFTGKNGAFNFSFSTKENMVHISSNTEKNEVKKEARKLIKVWWEQSKYLIVDSIKDIWIRPSTYLPLQIMELQEFLDYDLTKKS